MVRWTLLPAAFLICITAFGADPYEVVRSQDATYKVLKATKAEAKAFHDIDKEYGVHLAKLRKQHPTDYTFKRDSLNELYTREFMKPMTAIQKSDYRKLIRSLRQGFIKDHPLVDADNIFIWGGANLL